MSVQVKIVGFDRASDLVGIEMGVPPAHVTRVRQIAAVPATDPEIMGSYPLDDAQVATIADAACMEIDPGKFVYFLESYDE
jgi:hypothetical protein